MTDPMEKQINELAESAWRASHRLATIPTDIKNEFLNNLSEELTKTETIENLISANSLDLKNAVMNGLADSMVDRLMLNKDRILAMAEGINQVSALPDPVGEIIDSHFHSKGFEISKIRVPIGVIGIIYESRPNVTIDCAILCLKSGNSTILRGGKEAFYSNTALIGIIQKCLTKSNLPSEAIQLIPTTDRSALTHLLKLDQYIHCIIPRGGESLIRFVADNAKMPVIKHYKGVCNVYIEESSNLGMAISLVLNSKCQRPSVCNSAENLLFTKHALKTHALPILKALHQEGVELRIDNQLEDIARLNDLPYKIATTEDYETEYVDKIISIKTVSGIDDAIVFINNYGSGHSDLIVTSNKENAKRFQMEVDSATVYWNASTRFTDGFEFGLGAEIGISTDKLHARGPMGLKELTSYKYIINGEGQVR